jgi:hypothetical protein
VLACFLRDGEQEFVKIASIAPWRCVAWTAIRPPGQVGEFTSSKLASGNGWAKTATGRKAHFTKEALLDP